MDFFLDKARDIVAIVISSALVVVAFAVVLFFYNHFSKYQ